MARRAATVDDLLGKEPRRRELVLKDKEGNELVITLQAIGNTEYDDLIAKYPPSRKQKEEGAAYDQDKFCPALISECAIEPELTMDQATAIWTSARWARGELTDLFMAAVSVNNNGLNVPFNEKG